MTHSELVDIAYRWLLRVTGGTGIAYKECKTYATSEIPDVIGFGGWGRSVLIECKVSRPDFKADAKKCHAKPMGKYRFYCAPLGMIGVAELPVGYGLIEVSEKGRVVNVYNPFDDYIGVPPVHKRITGLQHKGHEVCFEVERNFMYSILKKNFKKV